MGIEDGLAAPAHVARVLLVRGLRFTLLRCRLRFELLGRHVACGFCSESTES